MASEPPLDTDPPLDPDPPPDPDPPLASDPPMVLGPFDPVEERREGALAWGISELAYTQMQGGAVDHALLPRAAALPAPQPWTCAGPRNIGGRILSVAQDPGNAQILYAGSAHGGLWRSLDAGDTWDHVGGQGLNDPVAALAIHPGKPKSIWAGTGSHRADSVSGTGLYRYTVAADGTIGAPRRLAPAPPPFELPSNMATVPGLRGAALRYTAIELDPENPNAAFVGSQTGLWHCIDPDDGTPPVWLQLLPAEAAALVAGNADPAALPPLASAPLASLNDNWPPYVTDLRVAIDPRIGDRIDIGRGRTEARFLIVFVAVNALGSGQNGGVFRGRFDRSTNQIRWDAAAANGIPAPANTTPQFGRARLALCRSQPNNVYAVFEDSFLGAVPPGSPSSPPTTVFLTTDSGDNWAPAGMFTGDNNQAFYSMVLEVHPDDPNIVVGGTLDLALSTDAAATFTQILDWQFYDRGDHSQHADQHALMFDVADRRKLWSGNDGGLSMARDIAAPVRPGYWRKRSHGIIAGQFQDLYVFPPHPTDVGAQLRFLTGGGLQDNGSWLSYGGQTWYHIGWADGCGGAIHPTNPRRIFASQNGTCNYPMIAGGLPPGAGSVIASDVLADIRAVQPRMEVAHCGIPNFFGNNAGGPFVGFVAQDPRPANAGQVIYSWTVRTGPPNPTTPLATVFNVPAATPVPANFNLPPAVVSGIPAPGPPINFEQVTAVAYGPRPVAPATRVDGWIGTNAGRLLRTTNAPLGAGGAAAAWTALAGWPPAPLRTHRPERVLAHPTDRRVVAVAASQVGAGGQLAADTVTVNVTTPGAIGPAGPARITYTIGGVVSAAINTAPVLELLDSGLVIRFAAAALAAGDSWTIAVDNTTAKGGATATEIEVIARLHGRVLLSYDRGATWRDVSWARARPAAPARSDSDSLPFCPVTSLRWDLGAGGAGPLRLFAGTLAGVYVLENLPATPPAAPPLPPPPGPLAGFNPVWRPFSGTPASLLPLTLVNDIEMITSTRILRIGTFGRGIWDCDLDGAPRRQLYIRQTVVENGRLYPRVLPATLRDDPRIPAGRLFMDHAHAFDIRIDTAPFDFFDDVLDGVEFDERAGVDDIVPLQRQAVYVQVHNSGWDMAGNVDVHLLWTNSPAAPLALGAAPATLMPAGLPNAATFYNPPAFAGGGIWAQVAAPRRIDQVRPGEPKVVRFDWTPPESLDLPGTNVALLALCTSPDDPLPAALPGGVATMAQFIASERRAALRIVPVRTLPSSDLFIRDGVDDDARLGNVAFVGRSPDIIAVQAAPADPDAAFARLIDPRPGDFIKAGVTNHLYVRVHNRGATSTIAEVRLWAVPLDSNQQPNFAIASWISVTTAPPAAGEVAPVPAGGTALVPVTWANPPDPNPADLLKAYGLVATIGSVVGADPAADVPAIGSADEFWAYFGERFGSDNAALRVLRYVP